jgi:exopolyphosphatase/guanosine-5'-triphosphate,3'-diphosphate pyrophosphatase
MGVEMSTMLQFRQNASCKHHAMRRWVQRRLGTIDHEDRVVQIACQLSRLTAERHRLVSADLRLLGLAAIVHDVGRSIDDETHPRQGARLLLHEPRLPISDNERRWLAYLTRYHRGSVPEPGCDGMLRRSDPKARLFLLLGFLRAADALDSRTIERPQLDFSLQARKLRVFCHLEDPTDKACRIYTRRKKFRLLEELLDLRVDVRIVTQADAAIAA